MNQITPTAPAKLTDELNARINPVLVSIGHAELEAIRMLPVSRERLALLRALHLAKRLAVASVTRRTKHKTAGPK